MTWLDVYALLAFVNNCVNTLALSRLSAVAQVAKGVYGVFEPLTGKVTAQYGECDARR